MSSNKFNSGDRVRRILHDDWYLRQNLPEGSVLVVTETGSSVPWAQDALGGRRVIEQDYFELVSASNTDLLDYLKNELDLAIGQGKPSRETALRDVLLVGFGLKRVNKVVYEKAF